MSTPIHVLPPSLLVSLLHDDSAAAAAVDVLDVRVAHAVPQELRAGGGSVTIVGSNFNITPPLLPLPPSASSRLDACWSCVLLRACPTCFQLNNNVSSSSHDFFEHELASAQALLLSPSLVTCHFSAAQVLEIIASLSF